MTRPSIPRYLAKHYFWVHLGGCFQKRLIVEWINWVKKIAVPKMDGHHLINPLKAWIVQKRGRKLEFTLYQTGSLVFSPCLSWFSHLQTLPEIYTSALDLRPPNYNTGFLGSPANGRLWDFLVSIVSEPVPYNKSQNWRSSQRFIEHIKKIQKLVWRSSPGKSMSWPTKYHQNMLLHNKFTKLHLIVYLKVVRETIDDR